MTDRKLFIFDWDGTLVDSAGKIVDAMSAAITELGLPPRSADEIRNIIGLGLPEALRRLYGDASEAALSALRERYVNYFLELDQQPCSHFEGAFELLEGLRARGQLLAVATGKSRRGLQRALAQTGWSGLFDATRCADETRSKPDPLMLQELLAELSVQPWQAVMIGDTEYDLAMAEAAGIDRIGVSFGAHAPERLQRYRPWRIVDRLEEVAGWGSPP